LLVDESVGFWCWLWHWYGFVASLPMKGQLYKQPIKNFVFLAINMIKFKNNNLLFVLINLILFKIAKALKFLNFGWISEW